MPVRSVSKKDTLLAFLQRGVAMVHLDARRPGVTVPAQYADDAHLRLNLSYRYSIPDLDISERAVQATLSFGGRPFQCILPWDAIFGITSHTGDGQVWPEDLPVEVMQSMAEHEEGAASNPAPAKMTPVSLAPVGDDDERETGQKTERADPPKTQTHRHLRLVR
ncbi:MAG TPA: ClpXP protease specificity-enhancing factor SspB [Myxococcales bacterium]|nr:ClpXP protease specificity-enhancing factor SspB [Myxococcales bacterium]